MAFTARSVKDSDLPLIIKWRTDPDITKWMNTDPVLTIEEQRKWLTRISEDKTHMCWLLEVDDNPAGLLQLFDIDMQQGTAEWGYYVGEKNLRSMAFAISIEMSLYCFCFDSLGLKKVVNSVHSDNQGTIMLHQLCGNSIVRVREHALIKNGEWIDLVDMAISREDWEKISTRKYERIIFS